MRKSKWIVTMTVAGLLATSGVVGASGLVEKVTGLLRNNVTVSVNGEDTGMHPVYINGKAYLPARETANALGYDLQWSGKEISLKEKEAEEEQLVKISGVIVNVTPVEGQYRIEVLGHGPNNWIILYADKETVLTDAEGKAFAARDLKAGMQITADYGPVIALSFPGQSHAAAIQVGEQRLITEDEVGFVEKTEDGWQLHFTELQDGEEKTTLTLNAGKETMLITPEGFPVEWSQIKSGTKVRAYYGPVMTKSLPPQSPAHIIVVLDEQLDPAIVKEFRDLAWKFVPESEKEHLITKADEALVESIPAKGAAIVPVDEKQGKILSDLQANDGKLIAVTYKTDQDALIGPLVIAIHPETKELVGFFQRM